jgi:hypothetical protein
MLKSQKGGNANEAVDEDLPNLPEKLLIIKQACLKYDIRTADDAIRKLRQKAWSSRFDEPLVKIAEHLLHSEFSEAVEIIEEVLKAF